MGLQAWDKALRDVPTWESQLHGVLPGQIVQCLFPSAVGGEGRRGGSPPF